MAGGAFHSTGEIHVRFPPLVHDALSLLAEHGLRGEVTQGGPHYKIWFDDQSGCKCLLIVARSPSSRRAFKRNRSELRRLLRRTGANGSRQPAKE
jgi:hypothetical protein